jgi:hypothetical protein
MLIFEKGGFKLPPWDSKKTKSIGSERTNSRDISLIENEYFRLSGISLYRCCGDIAPEISEES